MTDRERLIEILEKAGYLSQYPGTMARILIENGVVIPVRCKDCKRYEENTEARTRFCRRELNYMYAEPNGFCSYGERKYND